MTLQDELPQQRLNAAPAGHRSGSGSRGSVSSSPAAARHNTPPLNSPVRDPSPSYRPRTSNWGATRADRAKLGADAMRWDPRGTPHAPAHPAHLTQPAIPERLPSSNGPAPRPMRTASHSGQRPPSAINASFTPTTSLAPPTSLYQGPQATDESWTQARVEQHRAAAASIIQQSRPTGPHAVTHPLAHPLAHNQPTASPAGRLLDKRPPLTIPQPSPRRVAKSLSDRADDSE
jgi:hypothetical protein